MNLRENALFIVTRLKNQGFKAYFAGGCVRDMLLQKKPKDFDIATNALPDQIEKLFAHTLSVGKAFGVIIVIIRKEQFQVATFRKDGLYTDSRRPDSVEFTDEREDVLRRDITINGLMYDPTEDRLIDFVNGKKDLENKIIRAIGKPEDRIREDRLRMLRVLRFAMQLDFTIEENTFKAIIENSDKILSVSAERIGEEFQKMVKAKNPEKLFTLLTNSGLMKQILPEVCTFRATEHNSIYHPEGNLLNHTILILQKIQTDNFALLLGAFFHDIGKPAALFKSGEAHNFWGHEKIGAELTYEILKRFKYSNEIIDEAVFYVKNHMVRLHYPDMRLSTKKRWLRTKYFSELLELFRADIMASNSDLSTYEMIKKDLKEYSAPSLKPPPLVTGQDLLDRGYKPGPIFKKILEEIENLQLENQLSTKEEALEYLATISFS